GCSVGSGVARSSGAASDSGWAASGAAASGASQHRGRKRIRDRGRTAKALRAEDTAGLVPWNAPRIRRRRKGAATLRGSLSKASTALFPGGSGSFKKSNAVLARPLQLRLGDEAGAGEQHAGTQDDLEARWACPAAGPRREGAPRVGALPGRRAHPPGEQRLSRWRTAARAPDQRGRA